MNSRILKLYEKKGHTKAHIKLCWECKRHNLIPKGFFSKSPISTQRFSHLDRKHAKQRMLEQTRFLHGKLNNIDADIVKLSLDLRLSDEDIKILELRQFTVYKQQSLKKTKKFMKLKTEKLKVKFDSVINLSSRVLSDDEMHILALGFNFQPIFPDFPIKDIIASTEASIEKICDPSVGAELRLGMIDALNFLKSYKAGHKKKKRRLNLSKNNG